MQLVHQNRPQVPRDRLLPIDEVCKLTGLQKTSIYRLQKLKQFPGSVKLGAKCVRWPESRVLSWVQARIAEADGNAANDTDAKGAE